MKFKGKKHRDQVKEHIETTLPSPDDKFRNKSPQSDLRFEIES